MNTLTSTSQRKQLLKPSEAFARLQAAQPKSAAVKLEKVWHENFALTLSSGVNLLIPESYPKELIDSPHICTVPYGPQWLSGFLNVRGQVIPVVELEGLLSTDAPHTELDVFPYVLLLGQGEDAFAMAVRQLPKKVRLAEEHRLRQPPPLPARLEACIGKTYQKDGLWCEWDLAQFLRSLS